MRYANVDEGAWGAWVRYLIPKDEDTDSSFREEMTRLSVTGLRVIAGVCVAGPPLSILMGRIFAPDDGLKFSVSLIPLGLATLTLSFWSRVHRHARGIGLVVGFVAAVLQFWTWMSTGLASVETWYILSGAVTGVILVEIVALPVKPVQILGLGVAIGATFLGWSQYLDGLPALPAGPAALTVFAVLLCIALAGTLYHQRVAAHRARRDAEQAFEELRQAHVRVCVSENDASHGRFAAALSHELNSPLGALASAFDTMIQVHEREHNHPKKLQAVFEQAATSGRQSVERLRETVERMRHLTNLDRSEERVIDLNELWTETVALLESELSAKADVELELGTLPPFRCRPQLISAVFVNLLRNAAAAMDQRGTIVVSTEQSNGDVVMEVRDDGRGMSVDQLSHVFDPAFHVDRGRVSTTNWGLFVTRSIITEHGGHIEMDSKEHRGTTARILLHLTTSARRECSGCASA